MASTASPTLSRSLSPSEALVRPETPSALMTARSVDGSVPTTVALAVLPSLNLTVICPPCPAADRHHVVVGEDEPVVRQHHARPLAGLPLDHHDRRLHLLRDLGHGELVGGRLEDRARRGDDTGVLERRGGDGPHCATPHGHGRQGEPGDRLPPEREALPGRLAEAEAGS